MRILAIDTATENCSAALLINGALLTRGQVLERGHAEHILGMVDALLAEGGVTLRTLSAVAFGRGPGAFTGVRLAASVTQGLAFGAGLPVVPVSDLAALAQQALGLDEGLGGILACTDARMREVYWGGFTRGPTGLAVPATAEGVGAPAAVPTPDWKAALAAGGRTGRAAGVRAGVRAGGAGSGFAVYPQLLERIGTRDARVFPALLPRAGEIATLAAADVVAGRVQPPEQALPTYLRDDVARVAAGPSSN